MFKTPNPRQSFPELEKEVLAYWQENKTFQKSLEIRRDAEEFRFYDGPPFATGTPHYGHILAGILKDAIPRYQTMKGKLVYRNFGWDCHGLPIENIVEKKLGISGKKDIEDKIGIHDFNEQCRANVMTYVDEWRKVVDRTGRWVDMDNDYKTMDATFMESVWWVFKSVYDKGLIYEDYRVVPYCVRCNTPLSNFEVNQGYEDKQDKTVTVKFKVKDTASKFVLAWTTTPWTLPANIGLAVGADIEYVEVLDNGGETYILAKDRLSSYYKNEEDYKLLNTYPGTCLVGLEYEPLFDDFVKMNEAGTLPKGYEIGENAYHVILGHHVTTESGTGVVHIAPAYGEDDFIIGKKEKLGFVSSIDATGLVEYLGEYNGQYVFDFNETVIRRLKDTKQLVHLGNIVHSYPHCYRCQNPLIYRAISSWYLDVESIKDRMVAHNKKVRWVPESIKYGRFGKWLEGARDWNISRNRYWGSAIPVWKSEDGETELCVGSIKELYELNKDYGQIYEEGGKYYYTDTKQEVDIHRHFVDNITLTDPKTGKKMTRIPEVLDCWFESGSMPYASVHYPFENDDCFKFPAEFIAEGQDQTRGWFYTLLVLSTALFDNTPFMNVIVNGMLLAEDGKKMSKSLRNYTDPSIIMDTSGADAMRFYMFSSGAVKSEDLKFADSGVEEVVKKVVLPLWNAYTFFSTYANIDNYDESKAPTGKSTDPLDRWILSKYAHLIADVTRAFDAYELDAVTRPIVTFLDDLTNWYIRRSRRRFWRGENDTNKLHAYHTLFTVLTGVTKVMAPMTPFITEEVFRNLTGRESVHLEDFPVADSEDLKNEVLDQMDRARAIVTLGLALRGTKKIRVRQPLASLTIGEALDEYYMDIIREEVNVKEVKVDDMSHVARKICKPNAKLL